VSLANIDQLEADERVGRAIGFLFEFFDHLDGRIDLLVGALNVAFVLACPRLGRIDVGIDIIENRP